MEKHFRLVYDIMIITIRIIICYLFFGFLFFLVFSLFLEAK